MSYSMEAVQIIMERVEIIMGAMKEAAEATITLEDSQ